MNRIWIYLGLILPILMLLAALIVVWWAWVEIVGLTHTQASMIVLCIFLLAWWLERKK